MDFKRGKTRMNVEADRLSSLPDDLIHKILSFINISDAIGTSVLSSRWRFIWTSMPYLNLSIEDFSTLPKFSKFVTNVLSRRNNLATVYSLKLILCVHASHVFTKRILNYAFSHNIQQLNVTCLLEKYFEFPLSLFSSQSLKHLSLRMQDDISRMYRVNSFTSTWELPTLTTLDLHSVTLRDDNADTYNSVFTKCENLKNLTLKEFTISGSKGFSIFHPRLLNLTLEYKYSVNVVNVVAPQLKNLIIKFCSGEHVISAPDLASLVYKGINPLHLSTEGFLSLEKADISVNSLRDADAHQMVSLLQQLHNVKFLTLNLEILSLSLDLILHQTSPFVNLKSLKICSERKERKESCLKHKKVTMSPEVKRFMLDSSLGSTFIMVLREEIQAQELMDELRVLLEKEKDNSKTNGAHLEREKTHVESHEPKKLEFGENMGQMKSCWEDLVVQLQRRKEKACVFISKLQGIEQVLTKLPASKRANIQPCFSSLCAEAHIAISKLTK